MEGLFKKSGVKEVAVAAAAAGAVGAGAEAVHLSATDVHEPVAAVSTMPEGVEHTQAGANTPDSLTVEWPQEGVENTTEAPILTAEVLNEDAGDDEIAKH